MATISSTYTANLVASQREWQVVKGAAQDWALKDNAGAHVVRDGGAVDLSGLIAFEDENARLDDYTPVYTVKDAAGDAIFPGVTQDQLTLEPGAYTVEVALESDRYEVSATSQTYALSLYAESDFFELALRDETRGARVDALRLRPLHGRVHRQRLVRHGAGRIHLLRL